MSVVASVKVLLGAGVAKAKGTADKTRMLTIARTGIGFFKKWNFFNVPSLVYPAKSIYVLRIFYEFDNCAVLRKFEEAPQRPCSPDACDMRLDSHFV